MLTLYVDMILYGIVDFSMNVHIQLVLVRYSIYRSIAILAKIRYRYLVLSRYFDIIERSLFDTFDTFDTFDISILDIESIRRRSRDIVVDDDVVYGTALRSLN